MQFVLMLGKLNEYPGQQQFSNSANDNFMQCLEQRLLTLVIPCFSCVKDNVIIYIMKTNKFANDMFKKEKLLLCSNIYSSQKYIVLRFNLPLRKRIKSVPNMLQQNLYCCVGTSFKFWHPFKCHYQILKAVHFVF